MKSATVVALATLCGAFLMTCAASKSEAILPGVTTTTTTVKPWTQKFKDGLGKFFQGAAIAGAVQQGFQNARGHKKSHKHNPAIPDIKTKQ